MAQLSEIIARWDAKPTGNVLRRISARVTISPSGCWNAGFSKRGGYALIDIAGKTRQVHQVVYEAANGLVPKGLELDHLCRNRACCNPDHLEAVTRRENALRGDSFAAENARKTHCARGHALTPENCRPHKLRRGSRSCIICENAAARDRRAAKKEGVIA